jgi:hypothetical protein
MVGILPIPSIGIPAAIHFLTWLTIPCNFALVAESRLLKVRIAKKKKKKKERKEERKRKLRATTHL